MIHTIEIQSSITYKEYINLYNNNNLHFYKDTKQETKKQSIYISNSLDKINKIVIKKINVNRKKYKYSNYYINLVVNPIKIIIGPVTIGGNIFLILSTPINFTNKANNIDKIPTTATQIITTAAL